MPLIAGTAFLVAALLTCVLPIGLLLCFAAFFVRQARKLPEPAIPRSASAQEQSGQSAPTGHQHAPA